MQDETRIKLTGCNSLLDFSDDAKYILISCYDGGFKLFDCAQNKICFKTKVKGPKSDIDIRRGG